MYLLIMVLNVILLYCIITYALAFDGIYEVFNNGDDGNETFYNRKGRGIKDDEFSPTPGLSCGQMARTRVSPFVAILLLKTSGRYLGLGSILDKTTVLTAAEAVKNAVHAPHDLLVLAGRFGPWWGSESQVRRTHQILLNDNANMALIKFLKPLKFSKHISAIKIPIRELDNIKEGFDIHYAIFGIVRSHFDIPGDLVPKANTYIMKIDTLALNDDHPDTCAKFFKDRDLDKSNFCTHANGTFSWGCIGSPTVAVGKKGAIQIGTITRAPFFERDLYHIHTRLDMYIDWIRSVTYINVKD